MKTLKIISCAVIVALFSSHASAYIDPATGGMIVGGAGNALWAILLVALGSITAVVLRFYDVIKTKITTIWKGKKQQ